MADDKLAELLKTQKSLTEWLEDIKHKDVEAIRSEDNEKRERLKVLNEMIGLPFDKPTQFEATDLANRTKKFTQYLEAHGDELCALRLMPKEKRLPKLRMRGKSVTGAYDWFGEQNIDPAMYRADFIPHSENNTWATIFVVNKNGIQGEIVSGGHHQLTQGFHDHNAPHIFRYDFNNWMIYPESKSALEHLKILANYLHVPEESKRNEIKKELGSTFWEDYLEGYFETTDSPIGTWFIDYSPSLGKIYEDLMIKLPGENKQSLLKGMIGSPGKAEGIVQIIAPNELDKFKAGSVLVCEVTTPDYAPLMQKAAAIVTDQGGILSHAAIVARELKKPCIVATGNATSLLKDGQEILVDADTGTVKKLEVKMNIKPSISEDSGVNALMGNEVRIYSVGISTGGAAEIRMAKLSPKSQIIATTINNEGAKYAKECISEENLDNQIEVKVEDISQSLPYVENHFDFIYARLVLHYLPKDKLKAALQELYRVLKPGGKLYVVVRSVKCFDARREGVVFDEETGLTTFTPKGSSAGQKRAWSRYFHTEESISNYLSKAGFKIVYTKSYDEQLYADFQRTKISKHVDNVIETLVKK
jgi:phosphohistidine swiveling domain-containing protein/ubiquinone/menaquinone biosynthesis C-methylase UbiE